jgi:ATP-dependent Clp protease adaptor protein ClpS
MEEKTKVEEKTLNFVGRPHQVILFNDENHDQIEVTVQIIKAIHCSWEKAFGIMILAHTDGRAGVITAHKEKCEHVAGILEEIRLGTKIEPVE